MLRKNFQQNQRVTENLQKPFSLLIPLTAVNPRTLGFFKKNLKYFFLLFLTAEI